MKKFIITFKGQQYELDVEEVGASSAPAATTPRTTTPAPVAAPVPAPKAKAAAPASAGAQTLNAPMPGKILGVNVKVGDSVKRGDVAIILEAMKMQNEIMISSDAKVVEVRTTVGDNVSTGDVLLVLS